MQQVKRSLFDVVLLTWGMSISSFSHHSPLFARDRPQGFFWTNVFSRAFWMELGTCPSSTRADLTSMITSEGFTSLGHLKVQAPHDVQYQGMASSTARPNCFLRMIILTLKAVFPDSGQLPVHFPHCMQVSTFAGFRLIQTPMSPS